MLNKAVFNHLELIVLFHLFLLSPHFQRLQIGDLSSVSTPSFLARHMVVQFFLMLGDIGIIEKEGWKTRPLFRYYASKPNGFDDGDKINQNNNFAFLR